MKKIGFIGTGNMALAIIKGMMKANYMSGEDIYVYDVDEIKLNNIVNEYQLMICSDEREVVTKSDIIILAVKPNIVENIVKKILDLLVDKAVVSIVAGYLYHDYKALLYTNIRHLSIMPNTPLMVATGVTLFEDLHSLLEDEYNFVKELFESIGTVEVIPSYLMSVAGAVSGCGPAFMYMVIEAIADGAVKEGLPRELAYRLVSQTMVGAGMMQLETSEHPGVLKDQVCSPGGITIKGVEALEKGNIRFAFMEAIKKAK